MGPNVITEAIDEKVSAPKKKENFFSLLPSMWKKAIVSITLITCAIISEYISGTYVTMEGDAVPSDLILDYLPAVDLSPVFTYGFILLIVIVYVYGFLVKPRTLPFVTNRLSAIILTRSFFIIMTHLKNPPEAIPVSFPAFLNHFAFENDLFFSGHTALPFMFFLSHKGGIRWFFLFVSILMGFTALLMHRHYTIDVLAAFYITYGTYKICNVIDPPEKFETLLDRGLGMN